jgi:uncharacterized protein YbjT (DUF2867 family)
MQGLVTVFGGSGFLGTQIVRLLAKNGWRVRVAVRRPHLAQHLRPMGDVGQIQLTRALVSDPVAVARALEGADACVYLPGVLFERGRQKFETVHVVGARNVAEACARNGVTRLVHMSALGASLDSPSHSAQSKARGEAAVRELVPTATIVRPSVLFGQEDGFFNRFAALANLSPVLPLIGGGKTLFQPVFVGDAARAVVRCVEDASTAGQTYELGGPSTYSFKELMELMLREIGKSRVLLPLPFGVAGAIGAVAETVLGVVPIFAPPLTADQARQLRRDNVTAAGAPGLEALGVTPTAVEAIIPGYLWRYRKGGQFANVTTAAPVV